MRTGSKGSINLFMAASLVLFLFVIVSLLGFSRSLANSFPINTLTQTPSLPQANPSNADGVESHILFDIAHNIFSGSSIPSTVISYANFPQDSLLPSATPTLAPDINSGTFITTTEPITPLATSSSFLPNLYRDHFIPTYTATPTPPPPQAVLYCADLSQPISIPDNNTDGINHQISITDNRTLVSASLYVNIDHSWVGDLKIKLSHVESGITITALDRPLNSSGSCSSDDMIAILDDGSAQPADDQCAENPRAISGIYLPSHPLSDFSGRNPTGTWRLNVSDQALHDTGSLNNWCLEIFLADSMPPPTPTPTPVSLPSSAFISGMSGQDQSLNLDCESRSAVDWARHFGLDINEFDFLYNLDFTDDPESGFVGDPDGTWGFIPPNDYGVHAHPVAALLREYGLSATAHRSLSWDDLRAEIASGHPAIVWIIGGPSYSLRNGIPYFYTPISTGNTTIVAPYEHTVILVGYSPTYVTVLNGSRFVDISIDQFLDSWSALQFTAVLARP